MNLYDYVKSVIIMSDIENTNKNTKEKKTFLDEFLEWAEAFVFAIFIVILIFTFFIRIVVVKGNSMNDTHVSNTKAEFTEFREFPKPNLRAEFTPLP